MPYQMNSKYGSGGSSGGYSSPYGSSGGGSSGSFNSILLGRYDPYSSGMGGMGGFPGRSPLFGSYGGGSSYGNTYGNTSSSSSYGSSYGGYGSIYSSPYTSGSRSFGSLAPISEHSIMPSSSSSSGQRRLPRGYVPPIFPSSASPSNYTPQKKPAIFDTENIDVTSPRKTPGIAGIAKPGEITREKAFGTIKRGRTVIRIRTNKLKENPYLTEDEQKERAEERKKEKERENLAQRLRDELKDETNDFLKQKGKKAAGDKFREKFMIQSKKKKYSGYKRPTLTDIRSEKDRLQQELQERLVLVQSAKGGDAVLKMTDENGKHVELDVEAETERLEKVKERMAHLDRRIQRRYSKALRKATLSTTDDDSSADESKAEGVDRKTTVKLKKSSSRSTIKAQNPEEKEEKISPMLKRKLTQKFFFPAEGASAVQPEILDSTAQPELIGDAFEKNILAHRSATVRKTSLQNVKLIQPRKSSITNDVIDFVNELVAKTPIEEDQDTESKKCDDEVKEILAPKPLDLQEVLGDNFTTDKKKPQKKVRKVPVTQAPIIPPVLEPEEKVMENATPNLVKPIPITPANANMNAQVLGEKKVVGDKSKKLTPQPVNGIKEVIIDEKVMPKQIEKQVPQKKSETSPVIVSTSADKKIEEVAVVKAKDVIIIEKVDDKLKTEVEEPAPNNNKALLLNKPMLTNETRSTSLDKIKPKLEECGKSSSLDHEQKGNENSSNKKADGNKKSTVDAKIDDKKQIVPDKTKPVQDKAKKVVDSSIVAKSKSDNVILKPAGLQKQTSEPIIDSYKKSNYRTPKQKDAEEIQNTEDTVAAILKNTGKPYSMKKENQMKEENEALKLKSAAEAPKKEPEVVEKAAVSAPVEASKPVENSVVTLKPDKNITSKIAGKTPPISPKKLVKGMGQEKLNEDKQQFSFEKADIKAMEKFDSQSPKSPQSKETSATSSPKEIKSTTESPKDKVAKSVEKVGEKSPKKVVPDKPATAVETVVPKVVKIDENKPKPDSPKKVEPNKIQEKIQPQSPKKEEQIPEKVATKKLESLNTEAKVVEKVVLKPVEKVEVEIDNKAKSEEKDSPKPTEKAEVKPEVKVEPKKTEEKPKPAAKIDDKPQVPKVLEKVETKSTIAAKNEPKSPDKTTIAAKVVEKVDPKSTTSVKNEPKSPDKPQIAPKVVEKVEPKSTIAAKIEPKSPDKPQASPKAAVKSKSKSKSKSPEPVKILPKLEKLETLLTVEEKVQTPIPTPLTNAKESEPSPSKVPEPPKITLPPPAVKPEETKPAKPEIIPPKTDTLQEPKPKGKLTKMKSSETLQDLSKMTEKDFEKATTPDKTKPESSPVPPKKLAEVEVKVKDVKTVSPKPEKLAEVEVKVKDNKEVKTKAVSPKPEIVPSPPSKIVEDIKDQKKAEGSTKGKGVKKLKFVKSDDLTSPKSPPHEKVKEEGRPDDNKKEAKHVTEEKTTSIDDNNKAALEIPVNQPKPTKEEEVNEEEEEDDDEYEWVYEDEEPVPKSNRPSRPSRPRLQRLVRKSNKGSGSSSSSSGSGSSTLTAKSGSTSTGSSGSAGGSRPSRMPSPPVDDDDEEEAISLEKLCPAKNRPKYRKYEVEDFQFLKVLGKGSFGKVLLAELKDTDSYFAIKCLKKDVVLEDDDVECTMIERRVLLMGSKHAYLCHLFATFQTESHLFFVMEYLNGGDLMFHIQQSGKFSEERARFYGAEIVSGLKFLHKKGVMYRDLKLDNILLDYEGHVRIADFGMCKLQIYLDRTADTFCGTPDYMAPEIIKGLRYNQCVDWWAFGVLLYEMLVGQSPFSGSDEDELFWSICNEPVHFPRFLSKEAKATLERLLEKDASRRLGMASCAYGDVKNQLFFSSIDWEKLEKRELEPPFRPKLKHPLDVQYFDTTFTKEIARLTPVDKEILQSMDQTQFDGFSYTNPHTTD